MAAAPLAAGEPHLHGVTGSRTADGAAELAVVGVESGAVAFAAAPLVHRGAPLAATRDRVPQRQVLDVPAGCHGHLLGIAVGDGEGIDGEIGDRPAHHRDGMRGILCGLRDGEGERDVLLELGLDQRFGVREIEDAVAIGGIKGIVRILCARCFAGGHLGRETQGAVGDLRVLGGLAVGRVQLGRDVRVVSGDGGMGVVTGHCLVDLIIRRRCRHLPADPVQEQFRGGMVVHQECELDPAHQSVQRPGFRLGVRGGAAIGVVGKAR